MTTWRCSEMDRWQPARSSGPRCSCTSAAGRPARLDGSHDDPWITSGEVPRRRILIVDRRLRDCPQGRRTVPDGLPRLACGCVSWIVRRACARFLAVGATDAPGDRLLVWGPPQLFTYDQFGTLLSTRTPDTGQLFAPLVFVAMPDMKHIDSSLGA